jgi:hypothetical protein
MVMAAVFLSVDDALFLPEDGSFSEERVIEPLSLWDERGREVKLSEYDRPSASDPEEAVSLLEEIVADAIYSAMK